VRASPGLRARADRTRGPRSADPALAVQGEPAQAGGPRSGRLRRGKVFLVPGDSPVGYRLPLGTLPYVPPSQFPTPTSPTRACRAARCPTSRDAGEALPETPRPKAGQPRLGPVRHRRDADHASSRSLGPSAAPCAPRSRSSRATGGCACSCRRWRMEDYLDLLAAAEETARRDGPADPYRGLRAAPRSALNVIRVAPDPGVIEVNIHPAHSAGTTAWPSPRRSTRRRGPAAWAPTSS
jgi:uncharacterized protein (DUF2126 family)